MKFKWTGYDCSDLVYRTIYGKDILVSRWHKWAAVDKNGEVWVYCNLPYPDEDGTWEIESGSPYNEIGLGEVDLEGVDWKSTLIRVGEE